MSYVSRADIGGKSGHGPLRCELDEPVSAGWERRAMAVMLATASTGSWTVDHARSVLETLPDYDTLSYYERWIAGLEQLCLECGLLQAHELETAGPLGPSRPVAHVLRVDQVAHTVAAGASTLRSSTSLARFSAGDRVRTRSAPFNYHNRLPAYARGKLGTVERLHGPHVFPDTNARDLGESPQWLYTVVFSARELWGAGASPQVAVSIEAWEPYLEAAT